MANAETARQVRVPTRMEDRSAYRSIFYPGMEIHKSGIRQPHVMKQIALASLPA